MTEYLVKVHFWLLCCDDVMIEASSDANAVEMAKAAAVTVMESHEQPETIDFAERREGSISYVDRIDPHERVEVAGLVRFDDDRLYPAWPDFIEKIGALPIGARPDGAGETEALRHYRALIEEAKRSAIRSHDIRKERILSYRLLPAVFEESGGSHQTWFSLERAKSGLRGGAVASAIGREQACSVRTTESCRP